MVHLGFLCCCCCYSAHNRFSLPSISRRRAQGTRDYKERWIRNSLSLWQRGEDNNRSSPRGEPHRPHPLALLLTPPRAPLHHPQQRRQQAASAVLSVPVWNANRQQTCQGHCGMRTGRLCFLSHFMPHGSLANENKAQTEEQSKLQRKISYCTFVSSSVCQNQRNSNSKKDSTIRKVFQLFLFIYNYLNMNSQILGPDLLDAFSHWII